ncbi:unnamed protein product [Gadus morhua 'NCC']
MQPTLSSAVSFKGLRKLCGEILLTATFLSHKPGAGAFWDQPLFRGTEQCQ